MTSIARHYCNLCREELTDDSQGVGIEFKGRGKVQFRAIPMAVNHLCSSCLSAVVAENDEITKVRP